MIVIESILSVMAPPYPAGRPFLLGGAAAMLLGLLFGAWLFWLSLLFTLFCLYFFRDPERTPPARPGAVVAPADGRVVSVSQVAPRQSLASGRSRCGASPSSCPCSTCT